MNNLRHIIIGDVHGCLEELEELLKITNYSRGNDQIVLLGDIIDRGPDSLGVVRKVQELRARCIIGNHENNYYKWLYSHKGAKGAKDFYPKFSEKDTLFLTHLPAYILQDNLVMVHAGLRANVPLGLQNPDDLMQIRYTDLQGRCVGLKKISKVGKKDAKAHYWTEFWKGPENVVYGHNVFSCETPLIEMVTPGVTCYGLDTGCCFGGKLTALILETKEIFQVRAKHTYHPSKFKL